MEDEKIVLYEVCNTLTNNEKDYKKLYNAYLYLIRNKQKNGKLFYSHKSIVIDNKIKTVKTVKLLTKSKPVLRAEPSLYCINGLFEFKGSKRFER
jgi:hypothetical protein